MSITFSSNSIHLLDIFEYDREYLEKQESQNTEQKVFHRDTLEISQLSNNREAIMDRIKHTVVQSAMVFSDTRAEILKEIREQKGKYDDSDIVNACGLSYAKLYAEIEERYENGNEQYYKLDGTLLTKQDAMDWLDKEYENEVTWQKACEKVKAQREISLGHIPEIPIKEIEEFGNRFQQSKENYIRLYRENKKTGKPFILQNYMYGNSESIKFGV